MELGFSCEGCPAYRLVGSDADHYFLVNDGKRKTANLHVTDAQYSQGRFFSD